MGTRSAVAKRLVVAGAAVAAVLASLMLVRAGASAGASPLARPLNAAPQPPAKNLVLTGPVIVQLVDADAAFKRLPSNDFIGLREAYYAYDVASSTYWAAAQVVPSSSAYQAQVASQDDGGYTVFHEPPHATWAAADDGMAGAGGTTCAAYHVSIPAAVLAVWHWAAGRCTPPALGPGPLLLTYLAEARQEWWAGAGSISAGQAGYWLRSAQDLEAAVAAKAPGTSGYSNAANELVQLSRLPDAMQTSAQQKESSALTAALNTFFGTNGLYGYSAPSSTAKAFVATLEQEANLGTLSLVADPRLGKVPSRFPEAIVACPVLAGVVDGSVFGCKVEDFEVYYLVGTIESDDATTYLAYIVKGSPLFECKADGLSTAEQMAAKKMGGGCGP
ncbi:MAG TPA: hypothetical protein VK425_11175 [Acidimicrobiales bacterium]|nr:hypothetical protein [Acidimicrobiales bacterium]